MPCIYDELLAAGCRIGHHESDLYVLADDTSRRILSAAFKDKRLTTKPTLFRSNDPADNGSLWYEVPFEYQPFWRKRLNKRR